MNGKGYFTMFVDKQAKYLWMSEANALIWIDARGKLLDLDASTLHSWILILFFFIGCQL